jgi:hypothetical protein
MMRPGRGDGSVGSHGDTAGCPAAFRRKQTAGVRRDSNRPKRPEHGGDNQCEADGKQLDHASNCERQGRVLSRGKCDYLAGLPFCPQVARVELCKLP